MPKRAAVMPWNAPKRRKTGKITLAQLPTSVKPEVKFSDRSFTGTGFISLLQAVPDQLTSHQGNDGDQMVGSDCYLRSLDYSLELPTTGWSTCRVSVLVPRDPTITPTMLNPVIKYGHREFIVLHDELISVNERNHYRIKRTLNLKQKWNITGSVINENNVYVAANTDSSVVHSAGMRTYFTDP